MAMTNAERQARYLEKLKAKAERGVTAEMVVKATKLMYVHICEQSQETADWDGFVASARKRKAVDYWRQVVPADPGDDYAEFGTNAPLMRAVSVVASAVLKPPAE